MVDARLIMQERDRISGDSLYLDETDWTDIEGVLDCFSDDALPEVMEDEWQFQEDIAYKGMEMGVLPEHEGPFELHVSEEDYQCYRARRLGVGPIV